MRIGIDLGGTKIEGLALDSAGTELFRERIGTPRGEYSAIVEAVAGLVRRIEDAVGASGSVGIGIPGTVSPATGLVKNANTTELIGHPLDSDLSEALDRPVRVANDANCFALSEASDGAASPEELGVDRPTVFGVILGTGVGGGIVVGGRILVGPDAVAGEWGHNPLPWPEPSEVPGPECWCGRRGCIETWLSGPALGRDGDLERYCDRLARALATIVNVLNPDAIVLGGGVSNVDRLYERVPEIWEQYAFSDVVTTRLVRARHGDSSGVRGAAWLWPNDPI